MSLQPRRDDGTFQQQTDDQAIRDYVHQEGRVATYEIVRDTGYARTTVWDALGRLEDDFEVQSESGGIGRSRMWEPGPPYALCGSEFADLRPDGVTLTDAAEHLDEEIDGASPSTATISRFENGETRISDPAVRRALYQLYTEGSQ